MALRREESLGHVVMDILLLSERLAGCKAMLKEGGMVPTPSKPVKVLVRWSGGGACGGVEKGETLEGGRCLLLVSGGQGVGSLGFV